MVQPWFGRKRIGWGWSPRTWQGWAVTAGFVSLVAVSALLLDRAA